MIPEELLCAAAAGSCEAYVSYLESDYDAGEKHEFSRAFEIRIDKLKRRADHPVFYQTVRRVAVILLAILFAGAIWIAVDSDARAAFVGWVTEIRDSYYTYHHEGGPGGSAEPSATAEYRPTWLPEGFEEYDVKENDKRTRVDYLNSAEGRGCVFVYYRDREDPYVFIEASDTEICDVRVKTHPAKLYLSKKEDVTSAITWALDDGTLLYISGFFSESELLMMAESVRRIDYLPAWIPEGYAEKSVRVFDDKTTVRYLNDSGELLRFSYVITSEDVDWSFDVSQGETLDCRVGDQPGTLFRSHAEKTAGAVTWIGADGTAFFVTGFISEEDLIRMAESVNESPSRP